MSFWFPGQFGSLAAVPLEPGWSLPVIYYHASSDASASKDFAIGGNITAGLDARADLLLAVPTYAFADPVLGGQLALSMAAAYGTTEVSANATLTGPRGNVLAQNPSDSVTGPADLYPQATLRWNNGVHNFIAYTMAGIPVGAYEAGRLANVGTNHWAVDVGGGYTYLNQKTGLEFSAVLGVYVQLREPGHRLPERYQLRTWTGAPRNFSRSKWHVGLVGYFYDQLTGDSGSGAVLGDFKSRVAAIGPQVGYLFKVKDRQWYANLKGYWEFDAQTPPGRVERLAHRFHPAWIGWEVMVGIRIATWLRCRHRRRCQADTRLDDERKSDVKRAISCRSEHTHPPGDRVVDARPCIRRARSSLAEDRARRGLRIGYAGDSSVVAPVRLGARGLGPRLCRIAHLVEHDSAEQRWRLAARCGAPGAGRDRGEQLTVHNVRNFDYRTESDFTPRYEDRTYDLSTLRGVDVFMSYWGSPAIAHTIMSWQFDNAPPLAISIETRKRKGQEYSAIKGFFKQYEIIYVVADEHDVVGLRTNHRGEAGLPLSAQAPTGAGAGAVAGLRRQHKRPG